MEPEERLSLLRRLSRQFMEFVPHNRALDVQVVRLDAGEAVMSIPYADKLIGNPVTGVVHGGVVTSLMDACCGAAVFMKLEEPLRIATLDLRIDYLKPAKPGADIVARATCYKITRNVAFVRCMASNDDPDDAIASAAGTFMLIRPPSQKDPSQEAADQ